MSRFSKLLLVAIAAGAVSFGAYFAWSVAPVRAMACAHDPGMEWLRREYHLDDNQFNVISKLQADYAPRCKEMCGHVAAGRAKVLKLSHDDGRMTPVLDAALRDEALLEAECRSEMFTHIYAIAAVMNPADGRRYLETMARDITATP